MNSYILIILLVLCWTLNPFLKKNSIGDLSSSEYIIYNNCLVSSLVLIYFIYLITRNETKFISKLKIKPTKEIIISLFAAIITISSSIIQCNLLKLENASYLIPHIQPLVIILTVLIGYFIFGENFNVKQFGGILLIGVGLMIINKFKS